MLLLRRPCFQPGTEQLATIQSHREGEIQRMYDKLEMLWAVMNVSTVDIERFVELNQGISEQSVLVVRP